MPSHGSSRRLALALVSAAVLVLLLWLIAQRDAGRASPDSAANDELAADARPTVTQAPAEAAVESTSARASLSAADPIGGPELAAAPTPTGPVLAGRLVDAHGAPIVGAEVYVRVPRMAGQWDERVYAAPLHGRTPNEGWSDAVRAHSGADGRFELRPTPVGTVQLAVRAPSFAPLEWPMVGVPANGRELGEIEMSRGLRLAGRVVDGRGAGVANAKLLARAVEDEYDKPVWMNAGAADADGAFDLDGLPPGRWEIAVSSAEHPSVRVSGVCDTLECSGVELVLADGFAIRGRVEGAQSFAKPLFVRASYLPPKGAPRDSEARLQFLTAVDAQGAFEFRGLRGPEGQWRLRAQPESRYPLIGTPLSAMVNVAPGAQDVVLTLHAQTRFRLRAVDARSGDAVELKSAGLLWDSGSGRAADLSAPEAGIVAIDARIPPEATFVSVGVTALGFENMHVTLTPPPFGGVHDLGTFALQPAALTTLRLIDATTRAPVPRAELHVENQQLPRASKSGEPVSTTQSYVNLETDANGEAVVARGRGATSKLTIDAKGYFRIERTLEPPVSSDPQVLEIELDRGRSLTVLVRAGQERLVGAFVNVESIGRRDGANYSAQASTDEQGIAHLSGLATGSYRARVPTTNFGSHERGTTEFAIGAGPAHVEIVLPPRTELIGTITSRGRPLSGAVVRGLLRKRRSKSPGYGDRLLVDAGQALTDGSGRFRLTELDPGRRELVIEHPSLSAAARWSIELAPGRNEVSHDVAPAALRGRAVDASGTPISGCELALALDVGARREYALTRAPPATARRATTSANGAFEFADLPPGVPITVAPLDSALVAPSTPVVLAASELRDDWVLVVERGGRLHVRLARPDGKTTFGELIAQRGSEQRSVVGESGEATLFLAPGKWSIRVMPWDPAATQPLAGPLDAQVVSDETTELTLHVPLPDATR